MSTTYYVVRDGGMPKGEGMGIVAAIREWIGLGPLMRRDWRIVREDGAEVSIDDPYASIIGEDGLVDHHVAMRGPAPRGGDGWYAV